MREGNGWISECLSELITKQVFPEREGPAITMEVGWEKENWSEFILISLKRNSLDKNVNQFYSKSWAVSSKTRVHHRPKFSNSFKFRKSCLRRSTQVWEIFLKIWSIIRISSREQLPNKIKYIGKNSERHVSYLKQVIFHVNFLCAP